MINQVFNSLNIFWGSNGLWTTLLHHLYWSSLHKAINNSLECYFWRHKSWMLVKTKLLGECSFNVNDWFKLSPEKYDFIQLSIVKRWSWRHLKIKLHVYTIGANKIAQRPANFGIFQSSFHNGISYFPTLWKTSTRVVHRCVKPCMRLSSIWDMFDVCLRFARNMPHICPRYAWDVFEIHLWHV